jgi:hypothetical protein
MSAPNTPKRKSANGGKPKVAHAPSKKSRKPIPKDKVYVKKEAEDILMGRGGESNGHPGNQWYLDKVQLLAPAYGKASKIEKTNISESVLQMVSQRGGRFIQKEEDMDLWFIAHEKAARDKASQASAAERMCALCCLVSVICHSLTMPIVVSSNRFFRHYEKPTGG